MGGPREYARRQGPRPDLAVAAAAAVALGFVAGFVAHDLTRATDIQAALLECRAELDQAGARIDGMNRSLAELSEVLQ